MSDDLPLLVGIQLLRKQGAHQIVVTYDGSGDSGEIDKPIAYGKTKGKSALQLPIPEAVRNKIEAWAEEHIEQNFDNEGSYGEVTINLHTLQVTVVHHERYIAQNTSRKKFDFAVDA